MAHHVAELIVEAENAVTPAGRAKARKGARQTILEIWDHRASLPGSAYPLWPFKEVLMVLARLRPSDNPFIYSGVTSNAKRDQFAARLFDRLSRLIIALLLLKVPTRSVSAEVDVAATRGLDEAEEHVWSALHAWGGLFVSIDGGRHQTQENQKGGPPADDIDLKEVAIRLIDSIEADLPELRAELREP